MLHIPSQKKRHLSQLWWNWSHCAGSMARDSPVAERTRSRKPEHQVAVDGFLQWLGFMNTPFTIGKPWKNHRKMVF